MALASQPVADDERTPSEAFPFTPAELETLRLFCDTLLPALDVEDDASDAQAAFFARRASDLNVAEQIAVALTEVALPQQLEQARLVLRLLERGWFNGLLCGDARPFAAMSPDDRRRVLTAWRDSRLNLRRQWFQSLKRLAMFLYYGMADVNGHNPNWQALGYPPPPLRDETPDEPISAINTTRITADSVLQADVVIVGSGAGGGVMAGELSAAGLDVVVLEKGGYHAEPSFTGQELESTERLYENRGLVTTDDLGLVIIAGSTLGGGTVINWSASLRTPDFVLHEWAHEYGVTDFTGDAYQQAMDAVSEAIHVNTAESIPNRQNALLEAGSRALSLDTSVIPRNADDCADCGFCNFGCPIGAKKSTLRTYLCQANQHGARIVVGATVERVLVSRGRATGVEATVATPDGQQHHLTVKAKTVVVAAGSLHSPAILLRSGLTNAHIGRHLHLHPTTFTYGLYSEPVRGWSGKIMTRYVDSFRNLDGRGYGFLLETGPIHPGLSSLALPWQTPEQHKRTMSRLENLSAVIILTRDREGGQVALDKHGQPAYRYRLSAYDRQHLRYGIAQSVQVHAAAGAQEVGTSLVGLPAYRPAEQDFESYRQALDEHSLAPNTIALLSAHQMSSCRMGGSPAIGAIQPSGETYEVRGLYVADASTFPSASGANPMLTIMSIAYTIAQNIKAVHQA